MAEFFLELFSEEIPARMQSFVTEQIRFSVEATLDGLGARNFKMYYGARRQAFYGDIELYHNQRFIEIRGPKEGAPIAALDGFAKKYAVAVDALILDKGYWWFRQNITPLPARDLIVTGVGSVLTSDFWPKSMHWGQSGNFTWVRPLRRIVCLLDGAIVPIQLGRLTAGNETEGHRVLAPGAFTISSVSDWREKLRERYVIVDQDERKQLIRAGLASKASALGLTIVDDENLLDEVNGLVEWPVPLIGKIEPQFMSLPWEVRELSMKVNQKYFALRDADGKPAPYFAFVANQEAPDGGAAIIAGNERVLRARLSDAQHFWNIDLKTPLDELLPKLDKMTFHAKIGSQGERAQRISALAKEIADALYADKSDCEQAYQAGRLCKADLASGMVGEFPELQGIMGGYYAAPSIYIHSWDGRIVGPAIRTHYQPKGPNDPVPTGTVAISVALADKLDMLIQFFRIGETPTGSGDPYALRRAALGVIRIILENDLRLPLKPLLQGDATLFGFIIERLRVKLRGEGKRYDVLDAVLAAGADDDLTRVMLRVDALGEMLGTEAGKNLLAAYRRAGNILRIEAARAEDFKGVANPGLLRQDEERKLAAMLDELNQPLADDLKHDDFTAMMAKLAAFRGPVDEFFQHVTVNADAPELRRNRLRLLSNFIGTLDHVADFSKIAA